MECELCGSNNADRRTKIGDAVLNVCDECVRFGIPVASVEIRETVIRTAELKEMSQSVKEDIGAVIRRERQKMNLTQEQLSAKLKEKNSVVKRIEEGWVPTFDVVRKLERFFKLNLIEEIPKTDVKQGGSGEKMSLADFIEK